MGYNKETKRLYYLANKERIKAYREAKKEHSKATRKAHDEANKDKIKKQKADWYRTEKGKKSDTMASWRKQGVNNVTDEMYDRYKNNHRCDVCKIEFKNSTDRCLDHDHETGDFRQVLCRDCNIQDRWIDKIKE